MNSIVYDNEKGIVIKCVTSYLEARAEKTCLAVLSENKIDENTRTFKVPKLYVEESSEYTVCMEYVPGIRAYDLVALLNHVIRVYPNKQTVSKAYATKYNLIGAAISMVIKFQSDGLQNDLRQTKEVSFAAYDFKGKLIESINYLQSRLNVQSKSKLLDEVEQIVDFLSQRVEVTFRDATLKNFIVQLPAIDGDVCDYHNIAKPVGDYLRPTNWQWTDTNACLAMLDHLSKPEELQNYMYSIDFESTHSLTTKCDDFLHLFTHEVSGISYDTAQKFLESHLGIGEEELNYAILLRCLRDGTRRLFYKCERPTIFATRYFHETVEYLLLVALEALERLRQNSAKTDFLSSLHSLLLQFRTCHMPWPWQLNMLPIDLEIKKTKGA